MRYFDDLSYDEIAATLEQPVGTVKPSAHRGPRRAGIRGEER
jgi:DNA-directed RNA polymerase specialized sigma24 family protein